MDKKNDGVNQVLPSEAQKLWTKDFAFISLINLVIFIGFNMTTTGLPVYVSSLGASDALAGLVTTFTTLATLVVRPFSGMMLDRFGRKGIFMTGIGAMAIAISAYALFPIIGIILAIRLLHGLAWGVTSTATSTIAADLIPRKRFAEGMGYFALSTSIAMAIAPALALGVLQNFGAVPMISIAAGCTLAALFLAFFQRTVKIEKVERTGKLKLSDLFEKRAIFPASVSFLINCGFGAITTFIALHALDRGITNIWIYFMVYAVVTLISRPIIGRIIDKKGFFGPGVFSMIGVVATLIMIAVSNNIAMFCVAGVFAGVGLGTGMATLQAMAVSTVSHQRRGVATSTFFFGFDAGIGVGAAFAGVVSGAIGYGNMFLVVAVFPALALILFLTMGRKKMADYTTN